MPVTLPNGRSRPKHNLFFASVPPAAIRARMAEAWRRHGTGERFRGRTLHMTILGIAGVDRLDPELVALSMRAASETDFLRVGLHFDRLVEFGGRSLVIATEGRNASLVTLSRMLRSRLARGGIRARGQEPKSPHVTLAYGEGFPGVRMVADPIAWTIRDFALIDSLQGKGRHVILGRWPPDPGEPTGYPAAGPVPSSSDRK